MARQRSAWRQPVLLLAAMLATACSGNPATARRGYIGQPPDVRFDQRIETYPVAGTDRAALGRAVRAAPLGRGGARRFAGYYEWSLSWRYESWREGGQCRVSRAFVDVRATVTMPEWKAPADADPAIVEEWKRFLTALATHEAGHRDLVLDGAARIQQAILGVGPLDCPAVQAAVEQATRPLLASLNADHHQYDQNTRHGATQGAVWNGGGVQPWWETSQ